MRPRVVAIVPSAGFGRRLGMKTKKPFVALKGKPLVSYALKTINDCDAVDCIIIACEDGCVAKFEKLVSRLGIDKVGAVVVGGKTRSRSVFNCLKNLGGSFDVVLIHDGARPFVSDAMIRGSVAAAGKYGASIVAVPEIDTVKSADRRGFVKKTLDRSSIFRAQTPQAFSMKVIMTAYRRYGPAGVTDDSGLVERMGAKIKILEGSYRNIKITTKEDLAIAEALL